MPSVGCDIPIVGIRNKGWKGSPLPVQYLLPCPSVVGGLSSPVQTGVGKSADGISKALTNK